MKHTPGPWEVELISDQRAWGYVRNVGWTPGDCAIARVMRHNRDYEANARLIEAAPDQYDLLTEALDLVPRISDDDPMAAELFEWCRKARAAIAKTTGEK